MSDFAIEGISSLYSLDLTLLDGPVLRFCSLANFTTPIVRGGITYTPIPIETEGFEWKVNGAMPQPTIVISNLYSGMDQLFADYGELLGCDITHTRILAEWLDDGENPNPTAFLSEDTFVIAQKTSHNASMVAFKLSTRADQQGTMLPRRLVFRDICSHIYRRWTGTGYDYSIATCPYAGSAKFDAADVPTSSGAEDQCSRRLSGCRLRFPGLPLPTRAFPGVGLRR